jgi:HlyD family secretion protein
MKTEAGKNQLANTHEIEIKEAGKVTSAADAGSDVAAQPAPATEASHLGPVTGGGALGPHIQPVRRPRPAPRKRSQPWGWVLVVLVAVAAGVGTFFYVRSTQTNPAFVGQTVNATTRQPVTVSLSSTGQVQPNADQSVTFSTSGTITKLYKNLGDTVKAGDTLAQIDDTSLQTDLKSAQAAYDQQLANYNTTIAGATQKDLEVAQDQLDSAKASYDQTVKGTATAQDIASANASIASASGQIGTAQANLKSAQAKLAQDQQGGSPSDIASAKSGVSSAQASLDNARAQQAKTLAGNDAATIEAAQSSYDQAVASQQRTLSSLNLQIASDQMAKQEDLLALQDAQEKYQEQVTANRNADGTLKSNLTQAQIDAETAALRTMQTAQDTYNKSDLTLNDANIQLQTQTATLQSSVDNAKAQLDKAKAGPTQADIASAAASVASAQAGLDSANKALIALTPTDATLAADEASVASAQQSIISAQAGVASAQANLAKLSGGTPDQVAQADSNVKEAQATLDDLKAGPTQNTIAIAKAQLDVAQTNLDKARASLTTATVTSPISGVIITAPIVVGQQVGASTVVYEVVDTSSLHVDVNVGETDISKITENMPVALNLDGIPNKSFTGKVTFISSKATVTSNVVNYTVTVTLDQGTVNSLVNAYPQEFAKLFQRPNGQGNATRGNGASTGAATGGNGGGFAGRAGAAALATTGICGYTLTSASAQAIQPKVGMTANVTFCLNLKAGVLSVPNRALKTHVVNGVRSSYVTVLVDAATNKTENVDVATGLAGDSYTEITGGNLKEGDQIVVSTASGAAAASATSTQNRPGGFGGGGFGGGGFGGRGG